MLDPHYLSHDVRNLLILLLKTVSLSHKEFDFNRLQSTGQFAKGEPYLSRVLVNDWVSSTLYRRSTCTRSPGGVSIIVLLYFTSWTVITIDICCSKLPSLSSP